MGAVQPQKTYTPGTAAAKGSGSKSGSKAATKAPTEKKPKQLTAKQRQDALPREAKAAIAALDEAIKELPADEDVEFALLPDGSAPGGDDPPEAGSRVRFTALLPCAPATKQQDTARIELAAA